MENQYLEIRQRLAGLDSDQLEAVATDALAKCENLACQKVVLSEALQAQHESHKETHAAEFGEWSRHGVSVVSAAATGLARGALGPLYGRLATLVPAGAGLITGLASKDPNYKAAGHAILGGAADAEAGIEMYDVGQILRVKLSTKVTIGAQPAPNAPPPAPPGGAAK